MYKRTQYKIFEKKKKSIKKMGGSLSKTQMAELNQWKNEKPKKDRPKWEILPLTDANKSRIESKKQDKIKNELPSASSGVLGRPKAIIYT